MQSLPREIERFTRHYTEKILDKTEESDRCVDALM